jgi:two-component system sensor histidine kinase ChiS
LGLNFRHSITVNQKKRYACKLEGFDNQWLNADPRARTAVYTNVPAGDYIFRVKTSFKDDAWSPAQAAIHLSISPPWWKTPWAYTLYLLMVVSLMVGFVHSQSKKVLYERNINQRLIQVDKLKNDFLSNTSHELRTPLNGIIGLAESLHDGAGGVMTDKAREDLNLIVSSGRRLSSLINDILDFSKLRNQQLQLKQRPIDLYAITEVVLKLSQPLVGEKKIQLINQIDPQIVGVTGDEDRLLQVMHNLIGNAIKFTHQGNVTVSAALSESAMTVTISDTGIGIEPSKFESIFASFEQADGTISREFGGTGIGLAITKQLIELHGGRIWLESTAKEGSVFHFTLPMAGKNNGTRSAEVPIKTKERPIKTKALAPIVPLQPFDQQVQRVVETPDLGGKVNYRILVSSLNHRETCSVALYTTPHN